MAVLSASVRGALPPMRSFWRRPPPASAAARGLIAGLIVLPAVGTLTSRFAPPALAGRRLLTTLAWVLRALATLSLMHAAARALAYERSLVSETAAAVPGSRFLAIGQPSVAGRDSRAPVLHYLCEAISGGETASPNPPVILHLSHGFGANCLTWAPFLRSLADSHPRRARPALAPRLLTIAHDRLGFGLSSRPRDWSNYGSAAAVRHAAALIRNQSAEATATAANARGQGVGPSVLEPSGWEASDGDSSVLARVSARNPTETERLPGIVLVGHSVGAILAARLALLSSEELGATVRGLVLIAPAAFLPRRRSGKNKGNAEDALKEQRANQVGTRAAPTQEESMQSALATKPRLWTLRAARQLASALRFAFLRFVLYVPLRLAVRSVIGSETFWWTGLRNAYRDPAKLTDDMLRRYRWPSAVRGADRGVASFVMAQLGAARSKGRSSEPTDSQVWAALCAPDFHVPTLVVHGKQDALVPFSVSQELCSRMSGATLVELSSGHVPHEEEADRVAVEISAFIVRCTRRGL